MRYNLFDHTADLGMEFFGGSGEELFLSAATGLFDVITDLEKVKAVEKVSVSAEGIDGEDLLVNWLRELLYFHQVKGMLLKKFVITRMEATSIEGYAKGEFFDEKRHVIKKEIKAVTYHDVAIEEKDGQWMARVVFDL
ncbi:MAG: archease [Deltaproteobacteria bacterium]|nr:archease [Deltaproteobacteria bacterium]